MTEERKRQLRWEGVFCLFLALVLVFGPQSAVRVQAADTGAAQQKATTGTLGENGGITWSYYAGTKTLTVSGEDEGLYSSSESPFRSICEENKVERMVFQNCKLKGNASYLFSGLNDIKELNLSGLDTCGVTRMWCMFDGCKGLTSLDVSGFDTGNVKESIKVGENSLYWHPHDESLGGMEYMFSGCSSLRSLDVSRFNTEKVTNMECMFLDCKSLTSLDISGFEIGSTTGTDDMFSRCTPAILKAPKTIAKEIGISMDVSYRDAEGKVYLALTTKNAGKELKRADLTFYEIQFNGNGSTGGSTSKLTNCEVGKSYTLPANKFKRTGYTFTGWNTKADGTGTAYANKASVKDLTKTNGATVTLYAQWKANSYSIAFKGNGSTGGSMSTLTNRKVGTSYTLPANKFKRTGYTFTGWNTKKDGSGTNYKNKASVKDLTKKNGATVTLYAQWKKAVTYQIKFNANGGTGKMSALKCKTGKSYKLPANVFKKKGYTFAGWNTKKDGKGKAYKNKATVKNLTKKSGATVTLYAQWKPNTYTVKFDGNKATSGKMKDLTDCQYDKKFKLPKVTYKRKGYTFAGWNTKKNGTGKSYKNGAQVKNLTAKNKGTVVLYAQWIKKK